MNNENVENTFFSQFFFCRDILLFLLFILFHFILYLLCVFTGFSCFRHFILFFLLLLFCIKSKTCVFVMECFHRSHKILVIFVKKIAGLKWKMSKFTLWIKIYFICVVFSCFVHMVLIGVLRKLSGRECKVLLGGNGGDWLYLIVLVSFWDILRFIFSGSFLMFHINNIRCNKCLCA